MKYIIVFLNLILMGCSSYVQKWHHQIDVEKARQEGTYRMGQKNNPHFDLYRKNKSVNQRLRPRRPVIEPGDKLHSTRAAQQINPQVQRQYVPMEKKRPRADDLVDNSNEGSLWSGNGQANYLFSRNNNKKHGDIVVIEVQNKLKKDISLELARAFPKMTKSNDQKKKDDKAEKKTDAAPATEEASRSPTGNNVHDRISGVVVEEVSRDHLLVRGRKDVLYNKRKRLVEVQALVARRDIADDDTVLSSEIIESSVAVLR